MPLDDSKLIFEQLAHCEAADATPGAGVHTIIENHDAWSHNTAILNQLHLTLRTNLANTNRPAQLTQRITTQRTRLQSLVTILPRKLPASA